MPQGSYTYTHTLFPQGQFTQYAFGMGGGYYCIQSRTWILIVMNCVAYTKKARLSSATSPRITHFFKDDFFWLSISEQVKDSH